MRDALRGVRPRRRHGRRDRGDGLPGAVRRHRRPGARAAGRPRGARAICAALPGDRRGGVHRRPPGAPLRRALRASARCRVTRPLVSIVTPSYNQAAFLEETLLSVLEQDYEPIEYLVVDDGSTDASIAIVERYADRLAWWTRQENAGQVAALNRGFARTSGAYMGYLNADDTLLPGAVARMAAELDGEPDLWLVYGDALYTDERSRRTGYLPSREFDVVEMVRRCDNHVVQPATLWRREAWERFGPLDERGWYFFDFEFYLRFPPDRVGRIPVPLAT